MSKKPSALEAKKTAALVRSEQGIKQHLAVLAIRASLDLTASEAADLTMRVSSLAAVLKSIKEVADEKLKKLILQDGEVVTEAGTRRLNLAGGYRGEVRPYRTGYDPRKVEALLRAKGASLDQYMGRKVVYEVDQQRLLVGVGSGVFTNDELETCRYDETWTLQPIKKVIEDE